MKKWTLTGKVTGFGETDRDHKVKEDDKVHPYQQNRRFIKPIDIEAVRPPVQPVRAPPPIRREAGVDSRSFGKVASFSLKNRRRGHGIGEARPGTNEAPSRPITR
jgi:hypothetical protein